MFRKYALPACLLAALLAPSPAAEAPVLAPELRAEVAAGEAVEFTVALNETADLSALDALDDAADHAERVTAGYAELREVADRSQAGLRRLLDGSGADYTSHWLVNSLTVTTDDPTLLDALADRPEVREIREVPAVRLPEAGARAVTAADDEEADYGWNIPATRAPEVWSGFGTQGEGVVIASIDSGVMFDHPALVDSYRGNLGGGLFSHDHNWFDPAQVCGTPSLAPCDNHGHGTHTLGTAVGGATEAFGPIGMAPGATWIAAKGCENRSCTYESLLRSGEWIVAPTDLTGADPRPELAPHIVTNSWGSTADDPFYEEIVDRWRDLGIFPVFAAGNNGPSCDSLASPGDYPTTFGVAAYQPDGAIARFSSRGTDGGTAGPSLAAPGVTIVSADGRSLPVEPGYAVMNGTSMAAPHVAGAVALLWSASPELFGRDAATAEALRAGAAPGGDGGCGTTSRGDAAFGAGRLDAYAAVAAAPRGDTGTLVITTTTTGHAPLPGARVDVTGPVARRVVATDRQGATRLTLPVGDYRLSATGFGHRTATGDATVTAGATTTVTLAPPPLPTTELRGTLLDSAGFPAPGSLVRLQNTPLPSATTDAQGRFTIPGVPTGSYLLTTTAWGCGTATQAELTIPADATPTVRMPYASDASGHVCHGTAPAPVSATTATGITGDDAFGTVRLPFAFRHYGVDHDTAYVGTNGFLSFTAGSVLPVNSRIPSGGQPNAAVMAFWDDLVVDAQAAIRTGVSGTAPQRRFAVEWSNVLIYGTNDRISFQVVLGEAGGLTIEYLAVPDTPRARGDSATIGIESANGGRGVQFSYNRPVLAAGTAFRYEIPGLVEGTVTDRDSGAPIADALVTVVRDLGSGATDPEPLTTRTDAQGRYRLGVPYGDLTVSARTTRHATVSAEHTLTPESRYVTRDFTLEANEIRGTVRDGAGQPIGGARVTLDPGGESTVTDSSGGYRLPALPGGTYTVTAAEAPCRETDAETVMVRGSHVVDLDLPVKRDGFGHGCARERAAAVAPVEGTALDLTGDDEDVRVELPFPVPFYGETYTHAWIATNGYLSFVDSGSYWSNRALPSPSLPDGALFPFWDDLYVDGEASVVTAVTGTAPHRVFTVEWRNVTDFLGNFRATFQASIAENGEVSFAYLDLTSEDGDEDALGGGASIGIESPDGTDALPYAYAEPVLAEGDVITFPSPSDRRR
ncbi:carboxypeptidase regulatory-like domain-containing protein [Streptomyces mayteni]